MRQKAQMFVKVSLVLLVVAVLIGNSCKKHDKQDKAKETLPQTTSTQDMPQISEYVSAYTAGEISRTSSIIIQFAREIAGAGAGKAAENYIQFDPKIPGATTWQDNRTLVFKPARFLKRGESYSATLDLGRFFENVPETAKEFQFQFRAKPGFLELQSEPLQAASKTDISLQKLEGKIIASDIEDNKDVEKILQARHQNLKLTLNWSHSDDGLVHSFVVNDIWRQKNETEILLSWDASDMDIDFKGKKAIPVYSLSSFKFLRAESRNTPDRHILLYFSDPLLEGQNLDGLIHLANQELRYEITGNLVKVHSAVSPYRFAGEMTVQIEPGVKNIADTRLENRRDVKLTFQETKPEVQMVGNGIIVPDSDNIPFPFKAVNLGAIDVQVIKIFENNIQQFFQVNEYGGSYELHRVGESVLRKKIELDKNRKLNLKEWNEFTLDLSSLVRLDPGAIYQVTIGFKKSYSLYPCAGTDSEDTSGITEPAPAEEASFWDYSEEYYYYEDYYKRNDPCEAAYYRDYRTVSRNVLASNLGIICKRAENGKMTFVVNDLQTTQPVSGAGLEVFDFQGQKLAKAETDGQGFATIRLDEQPFMLVAKSGKQRGYLKLLDGQALTLSRFDVSGAESQKGLRGYIYGERGVWRPGDAMHLTFILDDPDDKIPENHPVAFELFNPRGQLVERMIRTENLNGFYSFLVATNANAPTGNYDAQIKVGGATFRKALKIETIMPNRLKINFDIGSDYISQAGKAVTANLAVTWLHGAVAKNLKTDIQATLAPSKTSFSRFADYAFDHPMRDYSKHTETIFDGTVDANGLAAFPISLAANDQAPGMLQAHFACKVFEPGGAFSIDNFDIPFHPFANYVGISLPKGDKKRGMLLTDTDHDVKIITVDEDGKPVARRGVKLTLHKLSWKWWWDQSGSEEEDSDYNVRQLAQSIASGEINTDSKGAGVWKLRVNYPDWGRYLVQACDPGGHCSGKIVYIDWPGWAGRPQGEQPGGAAMLTFTADKEKYQVGENVTLMIPTGAAGRALVTLETGSDILSAQWIAAEQGLTKGTFKTTPDMAPNVYACVTLLQPQAQTSNDLPIRLYGVIPIEVENPKTHLQPLLQMADVLRPEAEVEIAVSEQNGREMTYTIAMVDEGLLDLTRFKTPDPWSFFFARQGLKVKTWDMYDYVIGGFGQEFRTLLSIGGDMDLDEIEAPHEVNRFKPVVEFLGPFQLKRGQAQKHRITIPMYVGSVRTMVIAGQNGAYGATDKTTPVRRPLMVLGAMPRVIGPDEEIEFFLSVFAMEPNVKDVDIEIKTDDLLAVAGESRRRVHFDQPGEELVGFKLKVQPHTGRAHIKTTAGSGGETAYYNFDVEVRNPNPAITDVIAKTLEPGEVWDYTAAPVGMAGTNSGTIEVSSIPPLNLAKNLDDLVQYPHGCIEQTTSAVFPQLYLTDLVQLPENKKTAIAENIRAGIIRISQFQLPNGGLGYWPGAHEADDWATNYAGHFMLEVANLGYILPPNFKDNWIAFQKNRADEWQRDNSQSELMQAYRLFLLALAEQPQLGAMNRFREGDGSNTVAKWLLASSYYLVSQPEVADHIVSKLGREVEDYRELSYTYGSALRDKAMILEAMSVMKRHDSAIALVEFISEELNSNKWHSTQTLGYCLLSMGKFTGHSSKELKIDYRLNENKWQKLDSDHPVFQIELNLDDKKKDNVQLKNRGEGRIFVKSVLKGIPLAGRETEAGNYLQLAVLYKDMAGDLIDPRQIPQGTDFYAEVTVENPGTLGDYEEMALAQIFPSGWEIHNLRLSNQENSNYDKPKYQDIRDDRVYTYFDIKAGGKKIYQVLLNASYRGKFYLPAVLAEAMYDANIYARQPGAWVEVVGRQK